MPTARLWCVYTGGWIAYLILIGLGLEADELWHGHFSLAAMAPAIWSIPQALVLALLWPLSGWLERKRPPMAALFVLHAFGAFSYPVTSYTLIAIFSPFVQPLSWYVWPVLYGAMTYGIVAVAFRLVRLSHARQRQAAAIQQAHALLVATELNALRNKLNPHFLFNTLHSIIALTRKNPDAAETALFQFSDMLRYVLNVERNSGDKNGDRVTLEDELAFVRDYLELESLRLGPRLNIAWELDDDAARVSLPALSLQPLVENSIKHAFNPHSRPGRLLIRSRVDEADGKLELTVGDDGPGADPDALRGSNGLGLRTVQRRLQLEYGPASALDIETAPGAGFVVTMSIPLASA